MKIKGLKRAVGDYKRVNNDPFSPWYGYLMFDTASGELWTDEFYSLGHNTWKEYHSNTIVNLGNLMAREDIGVSMKNVKEFISRMAVNKEVTL